MCFCFKQKTADEMRISDWSSDVCSSDLRDEDRERIERPAGLAVDIGRRRVRLGSVRLVLVVAATAHRQPPSSSLMRAISAPSSGRLTIESRAPWRTPHALSVSIPLALTITPGLVPVAPSRARRPVAWHPFYPRKTTP